MKKTLTAILAIAAVLGGLALAQATRPSELKYQIQVNELEAALLEMKVKVVEGK